MRILFDHGTPCGIANFSPEHTVSTARAMGWDRLSNGELLRAAEDAGFDLLLTTDQRIQYQQNLTGRRIALVVLSGTTKWSQVLLHVASTADAVRTAKPGGYEEVFVPFKRLPSA